jgi:hypothetical protein
MAKPNMNYWVDVVIGSAFAVSAASGLIFLLPAGGDGAVTGVLGVAYRTWDRVHLWASLALIAGVAVHLVLHAKWIAGMTERVLKRTRSAPVAVAASCPPSPAPTSLPRRRFLVAGGVTVAAGVLLATCGAAAAALGRVLERAADGEATPDSRIERRVKPVHAESAASDLPQAGEVEMPTPEVPAEVPDGAEVTVTVTPAEATLTPVPTATAEAAAELCVTCPRGLTNDPYPGRCRLYVDRDDDGICDRSVPQLCG